MPIHRRILNGVSVPSSFFLKSKLSYYQNHIRRLTSIQCVESTQHHHLNNIKEAIFFDFVIIGAGIIGLAIARTLSKRLPSSASILVVEQHGIPGSETSSRNSEVIHAGLYYPLDSKKTKYCLRGKSMLYSLCEKVNGFPISNNHHHRGSNDNSNNNNNSQLEFPFHSTSNMLIPVKRIGKWIVAQNDQEVEYLQKLETNAKTLGIPIRWVTKNEMREKEPFIKAEYCLESSSTGIIDSDALIKFFESEALQHPNLRIAYHTKVNQVHKGFYLQLSTSNECQPNAKETFVVKTNHLFNAAGLYSDKIAKQLLPNFNQNLYYCKGHYLSLRSVSSILSSFTQSTESTTSPSSNTIAAKNPNNSYITTTQAIGFSSIKLSTPIQKKNKLLVSRLIYPVPEKNLQGLGIHLTLDMEGRIKFGPDTLYIHDPTDYTFTQFESHNRQMDFLKAIQRYFPIVTNIEQLQLDYTGIRPKLSGPSNENGGFKDFYIQVERDVPGLVNLVGIESPGLTSCLSIAEEVVDELLK